MTENELLNTGEPKFGDLVSVTLRGRRVFGGDEWTHNVGPFYIVAEGRPRVEVLERANSPKRDPAGTVRRFGADAVVVWVKTDSGCWWRTPGQGSTLPKPDAGMIGSEVIGVVPGTPAAEATERG